MNNFTYANRYGSYENCYFHIDRYRSNNNLAVSIMSHTEGPILTITTNTEAELPDELLAIKDYSENEGVVEWLQSLDIIESVPTYQIPSGFVVVPVFRLTTHGKEIILGEDNGEDK